MRRGPDRLAERDEWGYLFWLKTSIFFTFVIIFLETLYEFIMRCQMKIVSCHYVSLNGFIL